MNYVYTCQNKIKTLKDDQETVVEHNTYFMVNCTDCCNVPVYHMLHRANTQKEDI